MGSKKSGDIEMKLLGQLRVTDEAKGEVAAAIGKLNEVDHGKDVIIDGAFSDGAPVKLSAYGHSALLGQMFGSVTEPPVGKGAVSIKNGEMVFTGKYFLNTSRGREAFETTKAMGPEQEWSLGFRNLMSEPATGEWKSKGAKRMLVKIEPIEVSPVTLGEAIGTRTLGAKCEGCERQEEAGESELKLRTSIADEAHAAAVKAQELYTAAAAEANVAVEAKSAAEAKAAVERAEKLRAEAVVELERFQRNMERYRA
jgi:hypothetical protein